MQLFGDSYDPHNTVRRQSGHSKIPPRNGAESIAHSDVHAQSNRYEHPHPDAYRQDNTNPNGNPRPFDTHTRANSVSHINASANIRSDTDSVAFKHRRHVGSVLD
ncbi:MAG TPA: hypothetical protein VFB34_08400 [Chloroflexota bacterium]|nr:hypothetical protein [Chloroflexota bacterium]